MLWRTTSSLHWYVFNPSRLFLKPVDKQSHNNNATILMDRSHLQQVQHISL